MKAKNIFYISAILAVILAGCKKTTAPTPSKPYIAPLNTFICKINGVTWQPGKDTSGNLMLEAYFGNAPDTTTISYGFFIDAKKGLGVNKERVNLHIGEHNNLPLKTYAETITFLYTDTSTRSFGHQNYAGSSGSITITGFDSAKSTVSGDFSFIGEDYISKTVAHVTDGHFNLKYVVR